MNESKIMENRKMIFSTLWIFVTLNYLYCDLMGMMDPVLLKQYFSGIVGGITINENFLFSAAILMEIPMVMIVLSRILGYRANRWANGIAATLMTLVMILTLFVGKPTHYYLFCGIIEIVTTLFILWYALGWKRPVEK
jgi:hypothetical protein